MDRVLISSALIGSNYFNNISSQNGFEVDFVCFNNSIPFSQREKSLSSRMASKIPKMLAWELYPGYDYYIWIDSIFNMSSSDSVVWFIEKMNGCDAVFFRHPHRKSIREEVDFCVSGIQAGNEYLILRYGGENMENQVAKYEKDGYEDNVLLCGGAFMYSKKIVESKEFNVMKEWFYHNCIYSVQDQLSLPYLLNKFKIKFAIIEENIYYCEHLK